MKKQDEPIIEVEHEVPTERTLTGFYILLWSVILVQLLFFLFMENYKQEDPAKPKPRERPCVPYENNHPFYV